jgi:hypothetical protein
MIVVSLDWLMRTSKVLEHLPTTHQQPTQVLKALKTSPSDFVELRMSLGEGSTFEIRRKTSLTETRADDLQVIARTVYAVRLLPYYVYLMALGKPHTSWQHPTGSAGVLVRSSTI